MKKKTYGKLNTNKTRKQDWQLNKNETILKTKHTQIEARWKTKHKQKCKDILRTKHTQAIKQ